jgi:S-adenosylmethionine-diacylglycerol 3-amino-3-carboxypropyl transferase
MVATDNFILRYANCWEDADVLLTQLQLKPASKVLSIVSGGENSLSLLTTDPELVLVVDINPKQLYLFELKKTAMAQLEREDCLAFKGFLPDKNRWKTYQLLRKNLSTAARDFWDKRERQILRGLIFDGRLERNLQFFAHWLRPVFHSKKTAMALMSAKTAAEQAYFYEKTWNTRLWRAVFNLFFSKTVMKVMAPDPAFFDYVKEDVSGYLLQKTGRHLSSVAAQQNHILHYALFGHFGDCLPHYLKAENYGLIKSRLDRLQMHEGFAETPITEGVRFDGFNLSNIFEYTTPSEFEALSQSLAKGGKTGARYVYWNLMLPRQMSAQLQQQFVNRLDSSLLPDFEDKGWVYFRCLLDEKL